MKVKIYNWAVLLLLVVLVSNFAFAEPIDDAKDVLENFYLSSQEKDIDSYIALHDIDYLVNIYGEDYRTYLSEGLNQVDINSYDIDFQRYTFSEDSLTLFYNLEAKASIDDESVKIDNDLVALFSIDDGTVKLKYIVLQETLIEAMNKEVAMTAATNAIYDEGVRDLVSEADGLGLTDSNFDYGISEMKRSKFGFFSFLVLLVVVALFALGVYATIKHKEKSVYYGKKVGTQVITHGGRALKTSVKHAKKTYIAAKPHAKKIGAHVKRHSIKAYEVSKEQSKKGYKLAKQKYMELKAKNEKRN